jgi:GNAT superfamily N-acetyltransferase
MGEPLRISTDRSELDRNLIHAFLSTHSYWAKGIPFEVVQKSIEHSLCFGGYLGTVQVAFARVVSDFATFANLVDVFVLPDHRGHGYSKQIVQAVMVHPQLQGLRRFTLATSDAQGLYARHGFASLQRPELMMEIYKPDIYQSPMRR